MSFAIFASKTGRKNFVILFKIVENQNSSIITECPLQCKSNSNIKESILKPIGKVIKNLLFQLEVKCPKVDCRKVMTLDKYESHEYYCFLPKCENYLCGLGSEKQVKVT